MKQVRMLSWNVNGIRAARKAVLGIMAGESPDILCLQETKAQPEQLDGELISPSGYHTYWAAPQVKGWSGVATCTKEEPLSVRYDLGDPGYDVEGRVIAAEYRDFLLFNIYFPNGKMGPERLRYKLDFYDLFLAHADSLKGKGYKLVICGDYNTAHKEVDIARPKQNEKLSGFLPVERAWMDKLVAHGYIDTFRHFNKEPNQYTWWDIKSGARARNVGWRIDYFFVSENLMPNVAEAFIKSDVMGSDHCPIGLLLRFNGR